MRIPNDFIRAIIAVITEEDFGCELAATRLTLLYMKNSNISDLDTLYKIYRAINVLFMNPHFTESQFQVNSKISFKTINCLLGGYQNIRMLLNIEELQINLELSSDTPNNVIDFALEKE
ncbi:hypothetical protein [Shewanella phaeophyticola]|uniref:Uncharacterized protein n=1 Tax=Shewanella phaeophyticola TaxID=2978345 RepID=A0ABT2NZY5_9GAMM|nr:hypothetical protein [Shewanella sp. KJ10-1]MCT8985943.1 hypothetical protein [Shewanella sp. KJ10-1]